MDTYKSIITLVAIIGVITGILMWSADHDKKVEASAKAYEECVQREFGTTPSAWYNENGQYPVCSN